MKARLCPENRMENAMSIYADTQDPVALCPGRQRACGDRGRACALRSPTPKNRRDAVILAGMDEHMLADIGLTRGTFATRSPSRSGAIRPQFW